MQDLRNIEVNGMSLARAVAIYQMELDPNCDDLEGDAWYEVEDSKTYDIEDIFEIVNYLLEESEEIDARIK